jgi:hypothetical protein
MLASLVRKENGRYTHRDDEEERMCDSSYVL